MAVGTPLPINYVDGQTWPASAVNDITGTINNQGGIHPFLLMGA